MPEIHIHWRKTAYGTEAAAVGAVGAFLLALFSGELNRSNLRAAIYETAGLRSEAGNRTEPAMRAVHPSGSTNPIIGPILRPKSARFMPGA